MDATELARLNARLRALEWNVQRLLQRQQMIWEEPTDTGGIPTDVLELVQAGNAVAAIKAYRDHTGVGLAEAKAVIDPLL